jgi:hypothetical protein
LGAKPGGSETARSTSGGAAASEEIERVGDVELSGNGVQREVAARGAIAGRAESTVSVERAPPRAA